MRSALTLLLFFVTTATAYCQKPDSLELISNDEFEQFSVEVSDLPSTTYNFIDLARKCYVDHRYDSAYFYLDVAKRLTLRTNNTRLEGDLNYHFGRALYYHNKHLKSQEFFQKSIKLRAMAMDTAGLAQSCNALGTAYKHLAKYSDAIKAFNRANQYYHSLNDSTGTGIVELNIGNVLKNLGKHELAKEKYHSALSIFKKMGNKRNQASCYNNLGNVFKNQERFDSAFYYMFKTRDLRLEQGGGMPLAYVYHNLANLYTRTENYDSAVHYIEQSIAIKSWFDNPVQLASDYDTYGYIYEMQQDWNKAIYYYERANMFTNGNAYAENKLDLIESLANCYYHSGNIRKAADQYARYFAIRDSLMAMGTYYKAEDELILYEYYNDSIRNEELILRNELQKTINERDSIEAESEKKRYFYLVTFLALLLLMIVYMLVSVRRRLQRTRKHQAVLAKQNEELQRTLISKEEKEILLKEVHHRVKNNLQIINSLIRLQSSYMNKANFHEKLKETENRIQSMALIHEKLYKSNNLASLSIRNYIEELSIHISQSYENNLKIKFNIDVEEKEYRIDSLIPLGLIINEIISNALKYAFHDRHDGTITIELQTREGYTYLDISDDGHGADLSLQELKEGSLGIDLIMSLTDQLDGELHLDTTDGFHYQFKFPVLG